MVTPSSDPHAHPFESDQSGGPAAHHAAGYESFEYESKRTGRSTRLPLPARITHPARDDTIRSPTHIRMAHLGVYESESTWMMAMRLRSLCLAAAPRPRALDAHAVGACGLQLHVTIRSESSENYICVLEGCYAALLCVCVFVSVAVGWWPNARGAPLLITPPSHCTPTGALHSLCCLHQQLTDCQRSHETSPSLGPLFPATAAAFVCRPLPSLRSSVSLSLVVMGWVVGALLAITGSIASNLGVNIQVR